MRGIVVEDWFNVFAANLSLWRGWDFCFHSLLATCQVLPKPVILGQGGDVLRLCLVFNALMGTWSGCTVICTFSTSLAKFEIHVLYIYGVWNLIFMHCLMSKRKWKYIHGWHWCSKYDICIQGHSCHMFEIKCVFVHWEVQYGRLGQLRVNLWSLIISNNFLTPLPPCTAHLLLTFVFSDMEKTQKHSTCEVNP